MCCIVDDFVTMTQSNSSKPDVDVIAIFVDIPIGIQLTNLSNKVNHSNLDGGSIY